MKFPGISKSLSLVGSCGNKKIKWRKTYSLLTCQHRLSGQIRSRFGYFINWFLIVLLFKKVTFLQVKESKAKYPFPSWCPIGELQTTSCSEYQTGVSGTSRLQAAQRQPEPAMQPGNKEGITGIDGVCREGLWQNKVESRGLTRPCRAFHISDPGQTGLPRFAVAMAVPAQRK